MSAVSEIMSKKFIVSIPSNSGLTALDLSKLMVKHKIGSIIVTNSDLGS